MNLSGTTGHADRVDAKLLHNRNHLSRFRCFMHEVGSVLSLVIHKTELFVLVLNVHEPTFRSNIVVSRCAFRTYLGTRKMESFGSPLDLEVSRVAAATKLDAPRQKKTKLRYVMRRSCVVLLFHWILVWPSFFWV